MAKKIDIKQTSSGWEGLWYDASSHKYQSTVLSLKPLADYKGKIRIVAMKNRYHKDGDNRPNMIFAICGLESDKVPKEIDIDVDVEDEDAEYEYVFTRKQVRRIMDRFHSDCSGSGDPWDYLPEDYESPYRVSLNNLEN